MTTLEALAGSYDYAVVSRAVARMKRAPNAAAREAILRSVDHPRIPEWRRMVEQAYTEEQEARAT